MNSESPAVPVPPEAVQNFFDSFRALVDASGDDPAPIVNALTSVILGLNGVIQTQDGESFSKSYAKHLDEMSDVDFQSLIIQALAAQNGG